jgi:hypothetical protein
LDPLNPRPEFFEDGTGLLRDGSQLVAGGFSGARKITFDDVFGHGFMG